MIGKYLCKFLKWHKPETITLEGDMNRETCKFCGKGILQDSQGNWF